MIHKSYMWEKVFYESACKGFKIQFQFQIFGYLGGTNSKNWKKWKRCAMFHKSFRLEEIYYENVFKIV